MIILIEQLLETFHKWMRSTTKLQKLLLAGCLVLVACGWGASRYWQAQAQEPPGRLQQIQKLIKSGQFQKLESFSDHKEYFATLNIMGEKTTQRQQKQLAKILFSDMEQSVLDTVVNKSESKAIVKVRIINYDVYHAALQVEISEKEAAKKTDQQRYDLLLEKAEQVVKKEIGKQKERTQNTVEFLLTKDKKGNWVVDGSDQENQLNLLAYMGIQVSEIQPEPTQENKKNEETKKKKQKEAATTHIQENSFDTSMY